MFGMKVHFIDALLPVTRSSTKVNVKYRSGPIELHQLEEMNRHFQAHFILCKPFGCLFVILFGVTLRICRRLTYFRVLITNELMVIYEICTGFIF